MLSVLIFISAGEQYRIVKKETGNSNDNRLRAGKNFKAIKTVGLVLSICFVTWMPYLILTIVSCYNLITDIVDEEIQRDRFRLQGLGLKQLRWLYQQSIHWYTLPKGRVSTSFSPVFSLAARSPKDLRQGRHVLEPRDKKFTVSLYFSRGLICA